MQVIRVGAVAAVTVLDQVKTSTTESQGNQIKLNYQVADINTEFEVTK